MKKIATAVFAPAGAAGALVGFTALPAAADTKSCGFYVAGQYVPAGSFCMTRVGSGRWITGIQDEFYGYKLCNYDRHRRVLHQQLDLEAVRSSRAATTGAPTVRSGCLGSASTTPSRA